jgi:transposase
VGNARARKVPAQLVEDEDYQLRHERVAGIDIAKAKADVCTRLPPQREGGRRASRLEEVPARSREILDLAGRLISDGVELVVMESTSDYWRIWFYLLESAGLAVQLVNSSHARQLAGRPKTDRLDAQWIARLAEMGLLRPSFVPPPEIRALRDLTRTRLQMVRDRTREWQRLEKLLEGALVKLSSAVHSLARTKTARDILEALAGGERDPRALAALASARVNGGRAAIEQSLDGMMIGDHHPLLIRAHLDHITLLDRTAAAIDDEIEATLGAIPAARGISADGVPSADPGPGAATLAAADRLAEIPGVSRKLAMAIIAETGLDMSRFPTASCLGLLGRPRPRHPPVWPPQPETRQGPGRCLPQGLLHPGRRRRRGHRHLPRRKAPPPDPPHRPDASPVRCRPLHPGDHLAPPRQPRGQVHRPRPRLARAQPRPRPQDPRPRPATPGPRPRRHPHRRRLNPAP